MGFINLNCSLAEQNVWRKQKPKQEQAAPLLDHCFVCCCWNVLTTNVAPHNCFSLQFCSLLTFFFRPNSLLTYHFHPFSHIKYYDVTHTRQ